MSSSVPAMLHYRISGRADGFPVLLLHGFLGSSRDWDEVAERLVPDHRVIAVDLPGHGRSVGLPLDTDYNVEGAVRRVCDVLDHERIDRAGVVGYSMGGRVALHLALAYPERCARVVLASASPGLAVAADREARRGADEARALRLEHDGLAVFLEAWYRQPLFETLHRAPARFQALMARRMQNDAAELARSLRLAGTGAQPSLWDRLPALDVPLLLVAGAEDGKFVEIAHRMALQSDRIHVSVLPDAGHAVHEEYPDAFAGLVRDFLRPSL